MDLIKVSIIIVSYNAYNTIENTIKSVIRQTYPNIEFIIIDGGSFDGTVKVIKKYETKLSYWISESDKGIYDAMNKGIKVCTGDFIYFLGADDILLQNSIAKFVEQCTSKEYVYYGDVRFVPGDSIYGGKFDMWRLIRQNISHQAIFYPSKFLKRCGYDLRYKAYADWYLNMVLFSKNIKFKYLNFIICNFNVFGYSKSGDAVFAANREAITKHLFGIVGQIYYIVRIKLLGILRNWYLGIFNCGSD